MIISSYVRSLVATFTIASALVALLAISTVAAAEPTLVSPADGATVTTIRPTMSWSLPGTDTINGVEVSSSSVVNPGDGLFTTVDGASEVFSAGELFWKVVATQQLHSGTWYWHVRSYDNVAGAYELSTTRSFTIAPQLGFVKLTVRGTHRGVTGKVKFYGNMSKMGLRVKVLVNGKKCMNKVDGNISVLRSELMTTQFYTFTCSTGRRLATGARVKAIATISGAGLKATKVAKDRV